MKPGSLMFVRQDVKVMSHLAGKSALLIRTITHTDWDGEPFFEFEVMIDGQTMWLTDNYFEPPDECP